MSGNFLRFVFYRLFLSIIALLGVVIAVFLITRLLPSNPAALRAGPMASEQLIKSLEKEMGLDKPLYSQFGDYLNSLAHLDLGTSWRTSEPVKEELARRLPATIELALTAFLFATIVGTILGCVAAINSGNIIDQIIRILATLGSSVASFWLALVGVFVFYSSLKWAAAPVGRLAIGATSPVGGTGLFIIDSIISGNASLLKDSASHLWLPALALGLVSCAPTIKMSRAAMKDVLKSDYIRTARAIGIPMSQIYFKDALGNAAITILTSLGMTFGYMMSGNLIIEQVFSWPGIGFYAWKAMITNDFNVVQGFVLLIACIYIFVNLLVDILYAVLDPRIRLE
jgi:peptide/nickel transport system permease protein